MQPLKLLATYTAKNGKSAKAYFDPVWGEYTVRWFDASGKRNAASDYFTGDKQDAIDTAKFTINNEDRGGLR